MRQPDPSARSSQLGLGLFRTTIDVVRERSWQWRERIASARDFQSTGWVVQGMEKQSGEPLRTLYFGSGNHLSYVLGWIYDRHDVEQGFGTSRAWRASHWVEERVPRVDFVVADMPWPYQRLLSRRRFLEVPAWINQRVSLSETWHGVRAGFRKSALATDLRRIRKYGLDFRVTREAGAIREFYGQMYVPHLRKRFGDAAYIEPSWKVQHLAQAGGLLQIMRNHQVVAAAVLFGWRTSLQLLWVGIRGDLKSEMSQGVFGALYYYGILHAFERGFAEIDLCGTRALLNDGVYRFKRRWGARVYDGWSLDSLMLRPTHLGVANLALLERSPMVARKRGSLVGQVFFAHAAPSTKDVARAVRLYASEGIDGLKLFSRCGLPPDVVEAGKRNAFPIELFDLSRTPDPLEAYCRC